MLFRSFIPAGPRLGDVVIEAKGVSKGYGDILLYEDMNFALPPGGIVGVIGPNGAGKTTLFRMLVGQEQPDAGSIAIGDTVALSYVDQGRDALDPDRTHSTPSRSAGSWAAPPQALTTIAATTRPFGILIAYEPMPAFMGPPPLPRPPPDLPTVEPAPAPTLPIGTGASDANPAAW